MLERGIPELEDFIAREREAINKYSNHVNAKPEFINRQNAKMKELARINNSIARLEYQECWQMIEAEMKRLEARNPNIGGHMILFNADLASGNYSQIQIKVTSDD